MEAIFTDLFMPFQRWLMCMLVCCGVKTRDFDKLSKGQMQKVHDDFLNVFSGRCRNQVNKNVGVYCLYHSKNGLRTTCSAPSSDLECFWWYGATWEAVQVSLQGSHYLYRRTWTFLRNQHSSLKQKIF